MARLSSFLAAVAAATSLAAAPAAEAAVIPDTETLVRVELDFAASNGFKAHLDTSEKKIATLTISRKGEEATYSTNATVTEEGLKVGFGRLGMLDVAFAPTTILSSTDPGEGCTGKPRTLREGIFTGTIEFRGERGYVRLEGPQAEGSMSVIPPWQCPEAESLAPFANISRFSGLRLPRAKGDDESPSLIAGRRRCECLFVAEIEKRRRGKGSIFYGAKFEKRDGMEITRVTSAKGGPRALVYDLAAGTATARPPRPFTGRATFKERPGPDLWRSTIQVPLLGADPLRTGGPGYAAALIR